MLTIVNLVSLLYSFGTETSPTLDYRHDNEVGSRF
jgi:hypothetical protein